MRIIAGAKRGMRLLSPKGGVSRPIVDRVKESLFSVLYRYNLPARAMVADLFSGVGSLGLESLSRRAEFVTFVERDQRIEAILKKNIEKAGFVKQSKVIRANAFMVGAPVEYQGRKYGLVFVDPPYSATRDFGKGSELAKLMGVLGEQVAGGGLVVVRTAESTELPDGYGLFKVIERRRWGTMNIVFLKRDDE
jgi:16S rRNA (guanine(966)-N(2))-methyltransferase RsmD